MFLRYEDVQILMDQMGKSCTALTMGGIVNAYKILVETSELKRLLGIIRRILNGIKTQLK
jgi:hypothetical protein